MSELLPNPEHPKRLCWSEYFHPVECDADCAGPLAWGVRHPNSSLDDEGYYVMVCQSVRNRHLPDRGVECCGNGANVITMHREGFPTDEEVFASAYEQYL